jgi:hypothetical protein
LLALSLADVCHEAMNRHLHGLNLASAVPHDLMKFYNSVPRLIYSSTLLEYVLYCSIITYIMWLAD